MQPLPPFVLVILGLIMLALGAESLVRGSSSLALRLGISPLIVGLTVVAMGTGSPELAVSVDAAIAGNSGIALGNIVGSNIANIGLILGLSALIRPIRIHVQIIRREVPLMIVASLGLVSILFGAGEINRWAGLVLLLGSVAYVANTYLTARQTIPATVEQEFIEGIPAKSRAVGFDLAMIILGLGLLIVGARMLVDGAMALAQQLGVSQIIIGLTVVAVGTSLPELATSIVATLKQEGDLVVGNIIGSNILNILCIVGIAAAIQPIAASSLRWLDLGAMMLFAVIIFPFIRHNFVLDRWEGAVLVLGYGLYIFSLLP
jgi:cation:H+ antiporter